MGVEKIINKLYGLCYLLQGRLKHTSHNILFQEMTRFDVFILHRELNMFKMFRFLVKVF